MGTDGLESVAYSGTAWRVRMRFLQQTPKASPPWLERDEIASYERAIDLTTLGSYATGETFAQSVYFDPPTRGTYVQSIPPSAPAPWAAQLEIWLTPWGFLEGASRYGVAASSGTVDGLERRMLSWQSPPTQTAPSGLRYTVNAYIDDTDLIERIETWVDDPLMGDFHVVQTFADYRRIDGLRVPSRIEQLRGGGAVFGVTIESASRNPPDAGERVAMATTAGIRTPEAGTVRSEAPRGPAEIERIDDRVYLVTGDFVSLVAEFEDHLLVFEAGETEARGQQVLDGLRTQFPDKPVRYIVNSHPHSDHTGGFVPFVRAGATVVTHENNVDFLALVFGAPRTLLGEEPLEPKFHGVGETGVFEDASLRVELITVPNTHFHDMLVAYLPRQKILFQADFDMLVPGRPPNVFVVQLAEFVDRTGLDFERYLSVHPAPVPQTKADVMRAIGK